jgi:hypothetical protein
MTKSTKAGEGTANDVGNTDVGNTDLGNEESKSGIVKPSYIVATEFRDINDFSKVFKVGDDVSHLHQERLEGLVTAGYVKKGD